MNTGWRPKVVVGRDIGMWLEPGQPGCAVRTARHMPRWVVHHWTGSENGIHVLWNTFKTRNVGYHFVTDYDGTIYQFADPIKTKVFHAGSPDHPGSENELSIGHAFVNKGFLPAAVGRPRVVDSSEMDGKKRDLLLPTDAQMKSALWLAEYLYERYTIPKRMPLDLDGKVLSRRGTDWRQYRGHLGHFHISPKKLDPGVRCLQIMQDHWDRELVIV